VILDNALDLYMTLKKTACRCPLFSPFLLIRIIERKVLDVCHKADAIK